MASDRHNADDVLISLLSAGMTSQQAANKAGVSLRTVARRLADPDFRSRLDATKAEALSRATAALGNLAIQAVVTLGRLLSATNESVALGAAKAILDSAARWHEASELEARLSALEAAAASTGLRAMR